MACGTPVVASDIAALRELGGEAVVYKSIFDVQGWADAVIALMKERHQETARWAVRRRDVVARASFFTWEEHTRRMVSLYREVLDGDLRRNMEKRRVMTASGSKPRSAVKTVVRGAKSRTWNAAGNASLKGEANG